MGHRKPEDISRASGLRSAASSVNSKQPNCLQTAQYSCSERLLNRRSPWASSSLSSVWFAFTTATMICRLTDGRIAIWFPCRRVCCFQPWCIPVFADHHSGRRQWRDLDFVGLWSTVFLTIYGWQATASVLSFGLNVWQSVLCTIIARAIQLGIVLSLCW